MTLGEVSKGRDNNLNLIRLIAAILVILSHSFLISYGADYMNLLDRFSRGQITFGNISVCIFFFYGGFLIMSSAERSKTGKIFFYKRIVRLIPSLATVILCTVFIVGPLVSSTNVLEYFTSIQTYRYLLNIILIPQYHLPGIFTNNMYAGNVNSSLWTLPLEFICYIVCFVMYKLRFTDKKYFKYTCLLFIPVYFILLKILSNNGVLLTALRVSAMFYVGMLYYVYKEQIVMNGWGALLFGLLFLVSMPLNILDYTILFTFPYFLAYIGFALKKKYHFLDHKPDISYQIYLVGCPIQQIICQVNGGAMIPAMNFIEALPFALLIGYILFITVDKRIARKA